MKKELKKACYLFWPPLDITSKKSREMHEHRMNILARFHCNVGLKVLKEGNDER